MLGRGLRQPLPTRLTHGSSTAERGTPSSEIAGTTFLPTPPDSSSSPLKAPTSYTKRKGKDDKPGGKDMRRSCAECRRLKSKCDRVFPCSNCRRRGCALICPDGDLGCMQGKRLVLASTEQLHERIAQLETALSKAHGLVSSVQHPLLAPEFLDGGFASQAPPPASDSMAVDVDSLERAASSEEAVVGPDADNAAGTASTTGFLPVDFHPDVVPRSVVMNRLRTVINALPSRERAREIADRFFIESEWFNFILRREEYDALYEPSVFAPTEENPLSPHKLACVFMVCTLQMYLDPTRDCDSVDGLVALYWDTVQQCFDTHCGWAATVPGVQALALMTWFVNYASKGGGDTGPTTSSLHWLRRMTAACQELELNKEPHPSLPMRQANFHRRVFWEATVLDCVIAPSYGHHTGIPIEQIEVRYPSDVPQWAVLRYEYIRRVSYPATDLGLRPDSNPPTPSEIRGLEELLVRYGPEAQPAIHCPYLVGEPLPELNTNTAFDVSHIQSASVSMSLFQNYLLVYKAGLRRIVERLRVNPEAELFPFDRHIVMCAFETSQKMIRLARYIHRIMPRIAGRYTSTWVKLFGATATIAAAAIWCGGQMPPSFVAQVIVELNDISLLEAEATSFSPNGDRPQAVREIVPVLQSMIIGRHPHVVGEDPSRVTANSAREDILFALLGGVVNGVTAMQSAVDWSSALAAVPSIPTASTSAPHVTAPMPAQMFDLPPISEATRRDMSGVLHAPGHEGGPGPNSRFPSSASPFTFDGQSDYDNPANGSPHEVSSTSGGSATSLMNGTLMEPPMGAGGVGVELRNRLQTMYAPKPWWGLSTDATGK
ncbi:hypothetical protein CspeluHIS016_0503600 [Cutaneotrichosporon spelunceum]|uniref:Zn(2)-C6 fungal-type domain-containing protein n=1 Tax=Cutaneotrichosporon spelunceum TaxID=1672016 RepID=A0AAD3YDP3_9TREE|nr:hypothetical protein CspeluHIS016_0503600 [Cutaneotrichosporon spelunceum]